MGLIDDTAAAPAPAPDTSAAPDAGSDVIAKTRDAVEKRVPAQLQDTLQRVVLAGQKVLYDKTLNAQVEKRLAASSNPAEAAGSGVLELMGVLMQESHKTIPKEVMGPATMVMLTELLDYLTKTGRIKGTSQDLETATQALAGAMTKGAGATGQGFDQMLDKVGQAMNDPQIAAAVQQQMQGA